MSSHPRTTLPEPSPFLQPAIDLDMAIDDVEACVILVDHALNMLFDRATAWERFGLPSQDSDELWCLPSGHRASSKRTVELLRTDFATLQRVYLSGRALHHG